MYRHQIFNFSIIQRNCNRNFKWPIMQRLKCPITYGALETFDCLLSREIFLFKYIEFCLISSKTRLYTVYSLNSNNWFFIEDWLFYMNSVFKYSKVNFYCLYCILLSVLYFIVCIVFYCLYCILLSASFRKYWYFLNI